MAEYLHGIRIEEIDSGIRPITVAGASVIGLIGTSPQGIDNQPELITGSRKQAEKFGDGGKGTYTIPYALSAIFDQVGANVVVVKIQQKSESTSSTEATAETAALEKELAAAKEAEKAANKATTDAQAALKKDPNNEELKTAAEESATKAKIVITARIAAEEKLADKTTAEAVKNAAIEGTTSDAVTTALQALLRAESVVKQTPRILIAPGFSQDPRIVEKMLETAHRLRAIVIADCPEINPDEDFTAYINRLKGHLSTISSDYKNRLYLIAPSVRVDGTSKTPYASAYIAGVIAKSDGERGFWYSPSNRTVAGINGTTLPISFGLGDAKSDANQLNEEGIATIIQQDGYRLWGNRVCPDKAAPQWRFLSVRRTADIINDSLLRAHLWAIDRNITKTYISEVTEGVNEFLRQLKRDGAILGGKCWANPEANTPADIEDGKISFSFEFTPPYPAEQITFQSCIVNNYLKEIFS